jgi:hypothetical protein
MKRTAAALAALMLIAAMPAFAQKGNVGGTVMVGGSRCTPAERSSPAP